MEPLDIPTPMIDPREAKILELSGTVAHLMQELQRRDAVYRKELGDSFRKGYAKGRADAEVSSHDI